jgi:ankyrin repeat protein
VQQLLAAGASVNDANRHSQMTPLMMAAGQGHEGIVQQLLAAGASVGATDRDCHTALHWAASAGAVAVVGSLLAAGAAVDTADVDGYTPLMMAASAAQAEVVQLLTEAGAAPNARSKDGSTALHLAALAKCATTACFLAAAPGTDVDARVTTLDRSGLRAALLLEAVAAVSHACQTLFCFPVNQPPLLSLNPLAACLSMQTPLLLAAGLKQDRVVEVLLAAGAAVDAANSSGITPLHFAAEKGCGRVVQRLLAAGANTEAQSGAGNWTPLHFAASKGAIGPIGLLVGGGADLRAVTSNGRCPLHLAAGPECLDAARLLLRLGASPSLKNQAGVSAIKSAAAGDASALSLLRAEAAGQRRCAACGGTEVRLQRCARCQAIVYCSPACQRQHWPQHKQRCKRLTQLPAP